MLECPYYVFLKRAGGSYVFMDDDQLSDHEVS